MLISLFLFLQLLYVVYCTVMIVIVIHFVPNYTSTREFTGLQFPISTLVSQLKILLRNQQRCALFLSQKSQLERPCGIWCFDSLCDGLWQWKCKLLNCYWEPEGLALTDFGRFADLGTELFLTVQGLALFLLLSFRTNSSYERWWEGRIVWEGMACKIQDTARIAMGRVIVALCCAMQCNVPCLTCTLL